MGLLISTMEDSLRPDPANKHYVVLNQVYQACLKQALIPPETTFWGFAEAVREPFGEARTARSEALSQHRDEKDFKFPYDVEAFLIKEVITLNTENVPTTVQPSTANDTPEEKPAYTVVTVEGPNRDNQELFNSFRRKAELEDDGA